MLWPCVAPKNADLFVCPLEFSTRYIDYVASDSWWVGLRCNFFFGFGYDPIPHDRSGFCVWCFVYGSVYQKHWCQCVGKSDLEWYFSGNEAECEHPQRHPLDCSCFVKRMGFLVFGLGFGFAFACVSPRRHCHASLWNEMSFYLVWGAYVVDGNDWTEHLQTLESL